MSILSQLLRFTLPRSAARTSAFQAFRQDTASKGSVKTQYYGYLLPNEGFPAPKLNDEMCWFIQWPQDSGFRISKEFKTELENVAEGPVRSLLFEFSSIKEGELEKGLKAPFCQFAIINLVPNAPRFTPELEDNMEKTFTDCYFAPGFTGGAWTYALNSNDAGAEVNNTSQSDSPTALEDNQKRLAYYCLGWETLEAHHTYAKTTLFDEAIDELKGWFNKGTGAFYVSFQKHE